MQAAITGYIMRPFCSFRNVQISGWFFKFIQIMWRGCSPENGGGGVEFLPLTVMYIPVQPFILTGCTPIPTMAYVHINVYAYTYTVCACVQWQLSGFESGHLLKINKGNLSKKSCQQP
jgi:hypothetical protein